MRTRIPIILVVWFCALVWAEYVNAAEDAAAVLKQADTHRANKQYDQAEQLYLALAKGNSPEAFTAQKDLVFLYITMVPPQLDKAEAAYQQLLSRFAKNEGLCQAIYEIAREYGGVRQTDKALQLHQSNVESYPNNLYGMYSQVEIVKSCITAGPQSEADAAVDKLLMTFAKQPGLPREVYQLGVRYDKAGRADRAGVFYRYVLDHWPQSPHAPWAELAVLDGEKRGESDPVVQAVLARLIEALPEEELRTRDLYRAAQDFGKSRPQRALALHQYNADRSPKNDQYTVWSLIEVVKAHIRAGDEPAAEQARNTMLTRYADLETLPEVISLFGDVYVQAGKYDKAAELYKYVGEHWPSSDQMLWAKAGKAKLLIASGDDTAAQKAINDLMLEFKDHSSLSGAVFGIGDEYYNQAMAEQKAGDSETATAKLRSAQATWQRIITELPTSPFAVDAWYFTGVVCRRHLGDYEKTLTCYQKVVDQWPDYKYAWSAQGLIATVCEKLKETGKMTTAEADPRIEHALKTLIERYPDSSPSQQAYLKLAQVYIKKQQWDQAAKYYTEFLEKYPEAKQWKTVLVYLGLTYERRGQEQTAAELYRSYLGISNPADRRVKAIQIRLQKVEGQDK